MKFFTGRASASPSYSIANTRRMPKRSFLAAAFVALLAGAMPFVDSSIFHGRLGSMPTAHASSAYIPLATSTLSFKLDSTTVNLISSNDDWSNVPGVEGYEGKNLTATYGVDPQTVLGTEFASNALPVAGQTQVAANKGNPSAFNAGGLAEFDSGLPMGLGMQGNVQANPYMVFYLNTTGVAVVYVSYQVTDLDGGSNNAVSQMALQYRVGETGSFINIPAGYIADATDGPNISGRVTSRSVTLPTGALNQPKVQVRMITTNAANSVGASTPDEWMGVNNVRMSAFSPSAAMVSLGGRIRTFDGMPVGKAMVNMTDGSGGNWTAMSNAFGYFSFDGVPAGSTYFFNVSGKRYTFTGDYQAYTANDSFDGIDFIAY